MKIGNNDGTTLMELKEWTHANRGALEWIILAFHEEQKGRFSYSP